MIKLIKITMTLISAFISTTFLSNAQVLKVNELWGNKYINIGVNDANSINPPSNWLLTFGNGGGTNLPMWSIGMYGNGLNFNRINNGSLTPYPGNAILYLDENWNVGIGLGWITTTSNRPRKRLDVRGDIIIDGTYQYSDKRYKKDIKPLNSNINQLSK